MSAPPDVLRPAAVTAERERIRLEQTADRSATGRLAVRARLGTRRLGTAEAAADGLRYRPVAWTVIAVLAVAWYLPGWSDPPLVPEIAASPSPVATAVPEARPDPPQAPAPPDIDTGSPLPAFDPAPVSVVSRPSPGSAPTPFTPPTDPAGDGGAEAPLTIRGSGWATRLPPTPLPGDDVPDGTLPVGNRIGTVDRVSFVRLSGDGATLELDEDGDAAREALGAAAVALCPILDGAWSEGPEQSFDDAPEWDEESCVGGAESGDRWTFDLGSFDDRTGDAGFALVPTTDAPPDFQVAFVVT